jgi:hypothetical protein
MPLTVVGDVAWIGSRFVAVGSTGVNGQADLGVWESADGMEWIRTSGFDPVHREPGYQKGRAVTRLGQRLVVVGHHGTSSAGLWVGPEGSVTP